MTEGQGMGRRGWGARAARVLAVAVLSLATRAEAQFCSNCILNSAAPQVAQFNVGTGTVRGLFTASTGTFVYLNATNLNVSNLLGNGSALTALNASQLTSGTVPAARISGAYTGITQVGTLTGGVWNGTLIAPAYGGTGANLSISGTAGGLPYFSGSGVQGVIASPAGQRVLATAGSGATPAWTTAPTIVGTNFSAIPITALSNGTLQPGVQVPNASLVSIDAAKVQGNIAGGADFLTTPLPISDLAPGTLPTTNAASSVTVTGTPIGTFGGPTTLAQFRVGGDGRLYDAKQFNIVFYSTAMQPGPLPAGVTIAASQVSSGTLAGDVIASSVAATAVTAGSYGSASRTITLTVGVDGRLTAVAQPSIALPLSQLNNGTLPSGVKLPATSVNAGTLPSNVIASSVGANGVLAGVYGGPTIVPQLTIGPDGRVTSAAQYAIPGVSSTTAFIDVNNNWHGPTQVSDAAWYFGAQTTIAGPLIVTAPTSVFSFGVVAATFSGRGDDITHLTPENFDAGVLPADVIASSVAVRKVGDLQLTLSGVTAGSKGTATRVPVLTVDAQGRLTSLTDVAVALSTGEVSGIVQTTQGGTGADWSAVTVGRIPYFSATGVMSTLAQGTNGYALQQAAGIPSWVAAVSSATNIAGGAAGGVPYQSAANTTALLAPGSANNVLVSGGAGAPSWSGAPTILGTNITGTASGLNIGGNAATVTTNANLTGNVTSVGNATTLASIPAISGALLTNLTAANIAAGTAGINISGNAATVTTNANLTGDVTSVGNATTLTNAPVIAKVLTGYVSGAGTVSATDSILQAIQKLNGNDATNANLTGPVTSVGNATTIAGPLPAISGAPLTNLTGANVTGTVPLATSLNAGVANQMPYQSGVGVTAFVAAPGANVVLTGNSGAPSWSNTPTLTGTNFTGIPQSGVTNLTTDLASRASTGTSVAFSTIGVFQNGVVSGGYVNGYYPASAIIAVGNTNSPFQQVIQNLSNGTAAASDLVLTNDLGSNTSFYLDIFINSSKYSQTAFTAQRSSATGIASSDSDLHLWAGVNGGLNNAASEKIIFGSSNPFTANIAGYLMEATASGPGAWVFVSSLTVQSSSGIAASSITLTGSVGPYDLTTTTGIYVSAGELKFKSGSAGVVWPDGTRQVTAPVAAADVGNSTLTYVTAAGSSPTSNNPTVCPAGSTATVTCNTACRLLASYVSRHQAGSTVVYLNFLFDGALTPIATLNSTAPCAAWDNGSSTAGLSCTEISLAMSSGVHTVCPAISTSGGGGISYGQLSVVPVK